MIRKPARHGVDSAAAAKSRADAVAAADNLLRSQPSGKRSYRAVLKQNRKLHRVCSTLREQVLQLEEALRLANRLADYDTLTGLPNRRLLVERFTQASAMAKRHRQQTALLFLDLDDFKYINDHLGHVTGDRLLQQVAARLTACIRASDTACRYGGDEFVVLLPDVSERYGALTAITKIVADLGAPYDIDDTSIRMTVSSGMAIHPDDGEDYADLMRHSDRLMYRNKALRIHRQLPHVTKLKVEA